MTLISLLLVLAIERVSTKSSWWQSDFYLQKYHAWLTDKQLITKEQGHLALFASLILPGVLLLLVQASISGFWLFVLSTLILVVCVGCPKQRACYKGYLQAANRGDLQACSLYADEMGHKMDYSFGQTLIWVNYQHYAAVVLWFVAFGAAGAVFYTLVRGFEVLLNEQQHPLAKQMQTLMSLLDWLPVRISALGFLVVGHFSKALPIWLSHLFDFNMPPRALLLQVAGAAEQVEPDETDCTEEPCSLVRLAKRNLIFLLVVISALTLSGLLD